MVKIMGPSISFRENIGKNEEKKGYEPDATLQKQLNKISNGVGNGPPQKLHPLMVLYTASILSGLQRSDRGNPLQSTEGSENSSSHQRETKFDTPLRAAYSVEKSGQQMALAPLGRGNSKLHQANNISVPTPSKTTQATESRGVAGMVNHGLALVAEGLASFHRSTQFPVANGVPVRSVDTTKIWGATAKYDSRNATSNLSTPKLKNNFKKYPQKTRVFLNKKIKEFTGKNSKNIDVIKYIKLHSSVSDELNRTLNDIKKGNKSYKLIKHALSLKDFSSVLLKEMKSEKQNAYARDYIHGERHANEDYFSSCFEYNKKHIDQDFLDVVGVRFPSERKDIYDDFHQLDKSFYSELDRRLNNTGIESYGNTIDKSYKKMSAKVGYECYKDDTGKILLNDSNEPITRNDFDKNHLAKLRFSEKENYEIYSHIAAIKKNESISKMPPGHQSVFEARKIAVEVFKRAGYTQDIPNDDNDKLTFYRKVCTSDKTSEEMKIFLRKTAALAYDMLTAGEGNQNYIRLTKEKFDNFNDINVDYSDYIHKEKPEGYVSIYDAKPFSQCKDGKEYYKQFIDYKVENMNYDAEILSGNTLASLDLTDYDVAKMKPKCVYFAVFKTQEIPKHPQRINGQIKNNNKFEDTSGSIAFIPQESGSLLVISDLKGIYAQTIFSKEEVARDGFLKDAYNRTYLEPNKPYGKIDYLIKSLYDDRPEFNQDVNVKNIALFNPTGERVQSLTDGREMHNVVEDTMRRMLSGWSDYAKLAGKDYGVKDTLLHLIPLVEEYRDHDDPEHKTDTTRLSLDVISLILPAIRGAAKGHKLGEIGLNAVKKAMQNGLAKKLSGQLLIKNTLKTLASDPEFTGLGFKGLKHALWLGSEAVLPVPTKMITSPIKSIGKSIKKNISLDFFGDQKYNLKATRFTQKMINREKDFVSSPIIHKETFQGAPDPMTKGDKALPPPPPPAGGLIPPTGGKQKTQGIVEKQFSYSVENAVKLADGLEVVKQMKKVEQAKLDKLYKLAEPAKLAELALPVKKITTKDIIDGMTTKGKALLETPKDLNSNRNTVKDFDKRYNVVQKYDVNAPSNVATYVKDGKADNFLVNADGNEKVAYDLYVSKDGKNIITSSSYKADDVVSSPNNKAGVEYPPAFSYSDIMFNVLKKSGVDLKNIEKSIQGSVANELTQTIIGSIGTPIQRGGVIRVSPKLNADAFHALIATDNCKATAFMLNQYPNEFGSKTITSIDFKGTGYLVMNIGLPE